MGTLVERKTRLTLLVALDYHSSDYICMSFANRLSNLPERLRKSMTYYQGRELTHHESFSTLSRANVYFCDPHSPWQRGTNENTNGLLRQYFPKGTDFNNVPDWVFEHVENGSITYCGEKDENLYTWLWKKTYSNSFCPRGCFIKSIFKTSNI